MNASTRNPITTFTRASHSPDLGSFCSQFGNRASKKNGNAKPLANTAMPSIGRSLPPVTDAASSVPINGPTHANDASANVSPIRRAPANPPCPDAAFRRVSIPDGIVISNAPSRLRPKVKNTSAINPFTHGFPPS